MSTKRVLLYTAFLTCAVFAQAQDLYWVFFTDKGASTFDPYTYFDAKAIERYRLNHADLYDISNYPLDEDYARQVHSLATESVGQSRWLNATAVIATPSQVEAITRLSFVREVVAIGRDMTLAMSERSTEENPATTDIATLSPQLERMGGKYFRNKGLNGKGVRIAVFDGGFPQVNTHDAFKHLRENGQIVKTWNFPNNKEDVYGWNSHGLMTLSCIAGREGEKDLGLATGAEFLLARTEVAAEPAKEEVWWQMAVEWADKNGAQIISSSLGYGKDRYYTKDMDGQSYVAKAGNMAARKGILVCNSAGNEGDDKSWRTIITPSDADSVLCVGGINPSLTDYEQTSFSSYGPSADGRQKPNVCAFAYARTANTGSSNKEYHVVPGTSFSCPLVAGFAACALQSNPTLTAMQLFHEIEQSADLYPYCDYSFGYGVPQADYFTGDRKKCSPTFKFEKDGEGCLNVVPLERTVKCRLFIKNSLSDGGITDYRKYDLDELTADARLQICHGQTVTVNLNGYTESYALNDNSEPFDAEFVGDDNLHIVSCDIKGPYNEILDESKVLTEYYFMLGLPVNSDAAELSHKIWSPAKRLGIRKTMYFAKAYGWGVGFEYGHTSYRLGNSAGHLDSLAGMDDDIRWLDKKVKKHKVNIGEIGAELYQRVRFLPAGLTHKGLHWDLGIFGNWGYNAYILKGSHRGDIADSRKNVVRNIAPLSDYRWNWGVTTRLTYDVIGIYVRYRINNMGKEVAADKVLLPRLEVGLQLAF